MSASGPSGPLVSSSFKKEHLSSAKIFLSLIRVGMVQKKNQNSVAKKKLHF